MALSEELIKRFQALHLAKYGESINAATAELQLKELAEVVRITAPKKETQHGNGNEYRGVSTEKRD